MFCVDTGGVREGGVMGELKVVWCESSEVKCKEWPV